MGESPLDQVALFVDRLIEGWNVLARRVWLDDRLGSALCEELAEKVAVVGGIAEDVISLGKRGEQRVGHAYVAPLTRGKIEPDQTPRAVGDGMDFRCTAASAAADSLRVWPPFPPALHRCALAVVLSIHCKSALSSVTRCCSMPCQMPAFDQRSENAADDFAVATGFYPRRRVGINGSIAAHWSSLSQYSFAIDQLLQPRSLN